MSTTRVVNRFLGVVAATALIAAAGLAGTEAGLVLLDRPAAVVAWRDWYADLRQTAFDELPVRLTAVAAAVLGLLLLLVQLRRQKRPWSLTTPQVGRVSVTSRLVAAVAVGRARRLPEVLDATARVRQRRVRLTVTAGTTDQAFTHRLRTEVTEALMPMRAGRKPAVRVRIRQPGRWRP